MIHLIVAVRPAPAIDIMRALPVRSTITGVLGMSGEAHAKSRQDPGHAPKHFLLIHGAWHGSWCWAKIVTLLEAEGHRVSTLDLPAHGIDAAPPVTVTLAAYAARVIAALDAIEQPVILVGHSMGGVVISTVAEARPGRIEKLVYLSAFLLPNGASLLDVATQDAASLATPNLIVKPDEGIVDVNRTAIKEIFYGHCEREDLNLARVLLRPNPLAPFATPLALTDANYGSVRRFYVSCSDDQAISPAAQLSMVTAMPCEAVHTLHTDHSPFLSQPKQLTGILAAIAQS